MGQTAKPPRQNRTLTVDFHNETTYLETGKKWGSSGGLRLCLLPGACVKPGIPTAEGAT
jgi:hypothetical protein